MDILYGINVNVSPKDIEARHRIGQEDFIWQEIWRISIHSFKVRWNDHLVNYFLLMYRYGINTNKLHLMFSRAEFWSFHVKLQQYLTKKTNELTVYGISCRNVTIFYRQELPYLVQVQEKLKAYKNSKSNLPSSCVIADDTHVIVVWLDVVVFNKHDISYFWNNVHLFKYYPVKIPQNCFNSFNYLNQTCNQVFKFSAALTEWQNWFTVFVNCRKETVM